MDERPESQDPQAADSAPDENSVPRPRRRGHRRVSGGRAPDPELAVADPALTARSREPDRSVAGGSEAHEDREHERWLKEQRPPHWG